MDREIVFIVLMLVLAGIALAISYANYQDEERLKASGERVRGLITHNKFHLGRTSCFWPVVRFTTRAGEVVEAEYKKRRSIRHSALLGWHSRVDCLRQE